jgi:hypothetical protein
MYRSKIVEIVAGNLIAGTILGEDEVLQLAISIADQFMQECDDVYDDSQDEADAE